MTMPLLATWVVNAPAYRAEMTTCSDPPTAFNGLTKAARLSRDQSCVAFHLSFLLLQLADPASALIQRLFSLILSVTPQPSSYSQPIQQAAEPRANGSKCSIWFGNIPPPGFSCSVPCGKCMSLFTARISKSKTNGELPQGLGCLIVCPGIPVEGMM